ncbi:hypothetical protein ACFS5M_13990 [Lacinutrix iliipiscaria]|uniref:I-spanin n=1 Tax=Lacinutrix iliipiscaria TaxID=1230532 RepID=A0ABW5WS25_9FLAO
MKKNTLILSFVALILIIIGQGLFFNHKLSKQRDYFTKEVAAINDSISAKDLKEAKILSSGKDNTSIAATTKSKINNKLKQDEEAIDNTPVGNDELYEFLAKHGENND